MHTHPRTHLHVRAHNGKLTCESFAFHWPSQRWVHVQAKGAHCIRSECIFKNIINALPAKWRQHNDNILKIYIYYLIFNLRFSRKSFVFETRETLVRLCRVNFQRQIEYVAKLSGKLKHATWGVTTHLEIGRGGVAQVNFLHILYRRERKLSLERWKYSN